MLNIKENNKREFGSANPRSKLIQVERNEIFLREELKTTFTYLVFASMITLALGGMSYSFIVKLQK